MFLAFIDTGVLISPQPDQEGNKLQRQKILILIYPIYNHNWRNIGTIYIYITRLASNEIFSPSNKTYREVGRAKDLSAPRYLPSYSTYRPMRAVRVAYCDTDLTNTLFCQSLLYKSSLSDAIYWLMDIFQLSVVK